MASTPMSCRGLLRVVKNAGPESSFSPFSAALLQTALPLARSNRSSTEFCQ
jgi:hypothetical protein